MTANHPADAGWDRVPERFRVKQVLANGRQAGVLIADDLATGGPVLLRVMPAGWIDDDVVDYFDEAARRLTKDDDDSILVSELYSGGRVAFLVRPYVAGQPLDAWRPRPEAPLANFIAMALRAVRALAALDACGVVHGNIKPSNVFVTAGNVVLADYGLCRLAYILDYKDTQPDIPALSVEPASDAAALGAVLLSAYDRVQGDGWPAPDRYEADLCVRCILRRLAAGAQGYRRLAAAAQDLEELLAFTRGAGPGAMVSVGAHDVRDDLAPAAFVPRHEEWKDLVAAFEAVLADRGQAVLVEGPAGIGKTRLVREFAAWAQQQHGARVAYTKSDLAVAPRPHWLLARLVRSLRDIEDRQSDMGASRHQAILELAALVDDRTDTLLSTAEAARRLTQTLSAVAGPEHPLLVIVDDCHFARDEDAELIRHLAELAPTVAAGVHLLFLSRGSATAGHDPKAIPRFDHVIRPGLLGPHAVRALVLSMTGKIDSAVVETVIGWSHGSPLMAQNAVRFLVDRGAIVPGPEGWQPHDELPAPPAVLTNGIRSLAPEAGSVLAVAAVTGYRGRLDILARAAGIPEASCHRILAELTHRGLLTTSDRDDGDGRPAEYSFTHDTVRELVCSEVAGEPMREIHRAVAGAMVELGHLDDFDLAFHLASAGESESAYEHAARAARAAKRRYSLGTAQRYFEIALRAREEIDLLRELGEVLMLSGSYAEALSAFSRALTQPAEPFHVAQTLRLTGETHFKMGALQDAEDHFFRALQVLGEDVPRAPRAFVGALVRELVSSWRERNRTVGATASDGADVLKAAIFANLTYCLFFHDSLQAAWAQCRQMRLTRSCEDHDPLRAHAYATHAVLCAAMLGRGRRAALYGERAVAARAAAGDAWGEGHAFHLYGVALLAVRQYDRSIELLTRAIERFDRTADRWEAHTARWHRAVAYYRLGANGPACEDAATVRDSARAIGDRQALAIATTIQTLACDGVLDDGADEPDLHDPYDVQRGVTLLLGRAIRHLGHQRLDDAARALDDAVAELRRAPLVSSYVAPVFSWRSTVARWQAEAAPPTSRPARRWAVTALRRTGVACLASALYPAEREHVRLEVKQLPSVINHAFIPGRGRGRPIREPGFPASPSRGEDGEKGGFSLVQGHEQTRATTEAAISALGDITHADHAALVELPYRSGAEARVVFGSVPDDDLRWLASTGRLRTSGDATCVRFSTRPPRWVTFLLLPIAGRVPSVLIAEREGPMPFSRPERAAAMIIRDTTHRLREVSEFTDATAASSIIREELFRTRLAAELHDEVGQRLSALLIESRRLENFLGQGRLEPVGEAAASIREQLSECNRAVRDLVYETSPPTISQFGLPAALRDLVERIQSQTTMTIDYAVDTAHSDVELSFEGLPRSIEITCFRIIQEALTNVIKHAAAEHCTVTLTLGESTLSATIEDDGIGFHADERVSGFGLTSMRERSAAAGGTISVTGNPGQGTVVTVVLPLLRSEHDRADDLT